MKKIAAAIAALSIALVALTACEDKPTSNAQKQGQKQTEQAFKQQSTAVPYPADLLKDSLERRNLREKLLRQNKPNQIGYVYILSFGKFLGYYTIKGKVSSNQSQMTTDNLIAKADFGEGWESQVVNAPGDDGSYGENEPGIFFFTTEGALVQVSTDYIYSDQPINVGDVPELNGPAK